MQIRNGIVTGILKVLGKLKAKEIEADNITGDLTGNASSATTLTGLTATVVELNKMDGVTATTAELNKLDGVTATTAELNYVDGVTSNIQTQLNGKANTTHNHDAGNITSGVLGIARIPTITVAKGGTGATTAAGALSNLGLTATAAELNYVDGVTSNIQTQLNGKANTAHTHSAADIASGGLSTDRLPVVPIAKGGTGATSASAALNALGLTATAAELNKLDGVTATTAELNYVDGVTSNIQTQLNNKSATTHTHNYAGSSSAGGVATSAAKLATARSIFGKSFDGSGNVSGQGLFYGTYTTAGAMYSGSGLQIRENDQVGDKQTDYLYAPKVGFHWSNKAGGTLGLHTNGTFYLKKIDGTSRATLDANLTGNADTATASNGIVVADTRSVNSLPNAAEFDKRKVTFDFKNVSTVGSPTGFAGNYLGLMSFAPWNETSGGSGYQMAFGYASTGNAIPRLAIRSADLSATAWGSWYKIYTSADKPTAEDVGAIKAISANSYYGMATPDGNTNTWIRTTQTGIIPYQSGGSGALGTSGWPFSNAYINTVYGNLSGNATTATSATSASKLTTARSIALGTGVSSTATNFDGTGNITIPVTGVKEAYLSWGGKNFSSGFGPIDAAMVPELSANRFAFMSAANISVEYSTNGGTSWTDYGLSNNNKIALISGVGAGIIIGASSTTKIDKSKYMVRVTINTSGQLYTALNKFLIYCSTNGSSGCYCTIQARLQSNYEAGTNTWVTFADKVGISGWSGYNIINTTAFTTYGSTKDTHYGQIRFTFGVTSHASSVTYAGLQVSKIMAFGGVGWTVPSTLARSGHMYSYDANQNVSFPAQVTATKFNGPATSISDAGNGSTTTFAYSKEGITTTSWFAAWNNYELRAISPTNVRTTIGAAASSHNQAASTITAGTLAGQVIANSSGQTYSTSLLRNSKLVSSVTNPTVNGEITWKYE